jgi:hypothetical protein
MSQLDLRKEKKRKEKKRKEKKRKEKKRKGNYRCPNGFTGSVTTWRAMSQKNCGALSSMFHNGGYVIGRRWFSVSLMLKNMSEEEEMKSIIPAIQLCNVVVSKEIGNNSMRSFTAHNMMCTID